MAGRPTECTEELIAKAREYLSDDWQVNYLSHDHAIPSIVGMCRVLNRARSAIYRWAEDENNEFKDILEESKEFQELVVLNGTLKGDLNAQIGKLVLGKHGYHEKQEIQQRTDFAIVSDRPLTSEEWADQYKS